VVAAAVEATMMATAVMVVMATAAVVRVTREGRLVGASSVRQAVALDEHDDQDCEDQDRKQHHAAKDRRPVKPVNASGRAARGGAARVRDALARLVDPGLDARVVGEALGLVGDALAFR
jgi:hypothetical protein